MPKLVEFKTVQDTLDNRAFKQIGPVRLNESVNGGTPTYSLTGVFQNFVDVNANNRVYPKSIWESQFDPESGFSKKLKERATYGMIEHPDDGITKLTETSHIITNVRFATPQEIAESKGDLKDGDIIGTLETLTTPHGRILSNLIESNVPFGVSSRGSGTTTKTGDHLTVNGDFILETWDVVFSPSVERAIPKIVQEVHRNPKVNIKEALVVGTKKPVLNEAALINQFKIGDRVYDVMEKGGKFFIGENSSDNFATIQEAVQSLLENVHGSAVGNSDDSEIADLISQINQARSASNAASMATAQNRLRKIALRNSRLGEPNIAAALAEAKPSPHKPMSKLQEAKRLKADVIRLANTPIKGLKPSELASMAESIDDYRIQLSTILNEDSTLAEFSKDVSARLDRFQKRLDEGDEEPAPPAPPAPAPPAPPAPPTGGDGDGDADDCDADCTTLLNAAELLRDVAEGSADPDTALQTAEELEAVADRMNNSEISMTDDEPFEDIETDGFTVEAKRVVSRLQRRNQILENRYNRLNKASSKLIEAHNDLRKKSSQGRQGLGESSNEYKVAAKQLADKYNKDMCELGLNLFALSESELYESNKEQLKKCGNWIKLSELTESLVKSKKAPPAPKVESTPPAPAPKPPLNEAEGVTNHSALQMLRRSRGK